MADLQYPLNGDRATPGFIRFSPCKLDDSLIGTSPIIKLYLPPSMTFSDGATYENLSLGLTAFGVDAANKGDGDLAATAGAVKSQIDELSGGGRGIAGNILKKLAGEIGPTNAIEGSLREAQNPNTRVLFKGVALRTFQFTFKMIPTSPLEALEIEKIITAFRTQLYPELSGGAGATSIAYIYPDMYLIEMYINGMRIPPRIKASFLTQCTTVFNSSSGAILSESGSNQYWSEVDITLSFGEGVTLHKDDVKEGF